MAGQTTVELVIGTLYGHDDRCRSTRSLNDVGRRREEARRAERTEPSTSCSGRTLLDDSAVCDTKSTATGERELLVEPLSQRHLLHPFGQVTDRLAVTSEQQLQVDGSFGRRPPQLVEPGALAPGEVDAGDVFERFTSSQHQRILGVVRRLLSNPGWGCSCLGR